MDPRHDNPIAGQRKRNSHPSCVSLSQHINLITSLHLRQQWGIWGHGLAFGMTRFWGDFLCMLFEKHAPPLTMRLSLPLYLSPHKGMSHKGNARACESVGKKKTHYRLFASMRKALSFCNMLTNETKKKKTNIVPLLNEYKHLSTTRASMNGSSSGGVSVPFPNEEL